MSFTTSSNAVLENLQIDYAGTSRNAQPQQPQFQTGQYSYDPQLPQQQQQQLQQKQLQQQEYQGQYTQQLRPQSPPIPASSLQASPQRGMSPTRNPGSEQQIGSGASVMPADFGDNNGPASNTQIKILSDTLLKTQAKEEEEKEQVLERNCCANCFISFVVWIFVLLTFPLCFCWYFNIVYEYERAIIFRMGTIKTKRKRGKTQTTGIFFTLPCIEEFRKVDMRTQCLNFQPQEIYTRDNILVKVDGIVYYRVTNAITCVTKIANPHVSIALLTQSMLRSLVAKQTLTQVLVTRELIAEEMKTQLTEACSSWGICIERVAISDVGLPGEFQRAMVAEAEELRYSKAKMIAAAGEKESSKAFKEAAEIISSTPGALQLRYLQTLRTIATENNSTIVFPFPMELLQGFSALVHQQQQQQQLQQQQQQQQRGAAFTVSMNQANPKLIAPEPVIVQHDTQVPPVPPQVASPPAGRDHLKVANFVQHALSGIGHAIVHPHSPVTSLPHLPLDSALEQPVVVEGHRHSRRSSDPEAEHRPKETKEKEPRQDHELFGKFGHKKERKDSN